MGIRYKDALKELQYKKSKKFILTGNEQYLKEQFVRAAKKVYLDSDQFSFYPGDEEEIRNSVFSTGFFGDRLIILQYYDQMDNKGFLELIKTYDEILIIVLSEKAKIKSKAISSVISLCTHVQCVKMSEWGSHYPVWLISLATGNGYTFVDGAEESLFHKVGPDMFTLSNEFKKLMIYKRETKTIDRMDVERVVTDSAFSTVYNILESVIRRDVKKALYDFDSYMKSNKDLVGLVGFLAHYFEKMYRLLLMNEEKMSPDGMAGVVGLPAFMVKTRYLPRSISLGKSFIIKCLKCLHETDIQMRLFSGSKRLLIERFIYSFGKK